MNSKGGILLSWVSFKATKESNTVDIAEFVKANEIYDDLEFSWWVPYLLRKQDIIISSKQFRVRKMYKHEI